MPDVENCNVPLHPVLALLRDAVRDMEIPIVKFGPEAAVL